MKQQKTSLWTQKVIAFWRHVFFGNLQYRIPSPSMNLVVCVFENYGGAAPSKKSHQQNLAARLSGLPALCRASRQKRWWVIEVTIATRGYHQAGGVWCGRTGGLLGKFYLRCLRTYLQTRFFFQGFGKVNPFNCHLVGGFKDFCFHPDPWGRFPFLFSFQPG